MSEMLHEMFVPFSLKWIANANLWNTSQSYRFQIELFGRSTAGANGFTDRWFRIDPQVVLWIDDKAFGGATFSAFNQAFVDIFVLLVGNCKFCRNIRLQHQSALFTYCSFHVWFPLPVKWRWFMNRVCHFLFHGKYHASYIRCKVFFEIDVHCWP